MTGGDASHQEVWRQYDRAFHLALLSACGSRVLLDTYTSIYDKYLRYLMITSPFRGQVTLDEHRVLLECALARDWRSAQKTLTVHIQDCVTQMIATMNTRAIAS